MLRIRITIDHLTQAVLLLGLMSIGIAAATTAQAAVKLFTAEWYTESFGNECRGYGTTGPHCTGTMGESEFYSNWVIPQGIQCNAQNPRCPFSSTPSDGAGNFSALGGSLSQALYCAPYTNWLPGPRPAKGGTATTGMGRPSPPLYRNPNFFTSAGQPKTTSCDAMTTDGYGGPGKVQQGNPITGTWGAITTGTPGKGGFTFAPAPPVGQHKFGLATTGVIGQFPPLFLSHPFYAIPYKYTYATLRNDAGVFGPGQGPGSFNYLYGPSFSPFASINVKQGKNKFGGTMKMLGALMSKRCLYNKGGSCWRGNNDWRYDAIGASAYFTMTGVVTMGAIYTHYERSYNTRHTAYTAVTVVGARFPWTTGSVTVTAGGRGPHKTIHYARGYDNRNTTTPNGLGTIQLVSPVLTRWFSAYGDYDTAGIGILRLKFVSAAPDYDDDAVADAMDNCSDAVNTGQDDTDGDHCGNLCDADYDNNGVVGFPDVFAFLCAYGTSDEEKCHTQPIPGGTVGFPDFLFLMANFGQAPGPSGTTAGTTACP